MTDAAEPRASADPSRYFPIMLLLFAGSGFAALIYEIVWFQMLSLAIGSTAVSIGVLLATFMGGLSLGSWLLPRFFGPGTKRDYHPLILYALIEAGIALFGLAQLVLIPLIDDLYIAGPQYGAAAMVMRALFCAVALLPSTILMGASLPAIARWAQSTPKGVSWWGFFYGINTAGAVCGSLFAGLFLMPNYDVVIATVFAACANLLVAVVSWFAAGNAPRHAAPTDEVRDAPENIPVDEDRLGRMSVLVCVALSGACSMGAQVVWTRLMGFMLGATVYVFSIILAVFLVGLASGSAIGSWAARRYPARALLGAAQLFAILGIAWTAYQMSMSLPFWPIDPLPNTEPHIIAQLDLVRVIWAILPATFFWGASVPLAFAGAAQRSGDAGRTVGGVYAANTLGAIAGALVVSLILIPVVGTQRTQQILMLLSGIAGLVVLLPLLRQAGEKSLVIAGVVAAIILTPALAYGVHPTSPDLIAYGRRTAKYLGQFEVLESVEGRNTSIAITRWFSDNSIQFHVAGKVEASDNPYDMKLERMLGHLPVLFSPQAKSVLIVGFGAGVTAGSFVTYPTIQRIVICEMEPMIPPTTTKYFGRQNNMVLNDPRTQVYYDDARHYVLTTKEKFDIITSDPIHPFVKGSAALYSKEYFQMLRERLNPRGVVTQWIPLYESDLATVKSEIATFFEVFPYASVWANLQQGQGYDVVLIGHNEPLTIDAGQIDGFLRQPAYGRMAADAAEVGLYGAQNLLSTYMGDKAGLKEWTYGAEINHDRSLRLQYLAGLALNRFQGDMIYRDMLKYKAMPQGLTVRGAVPGMPGPQEVSVTYP